MILIIEDDALIGSLPNTFTQIRIENCICFSGTSNNLVHFIIE